MVRSMLFRKPKIGFVRMKKVSIYDQLQLEEALFRVDKNRNWFLFNEESEPVTVVMGISGKPDQLLQLDAVKMDSIPVLKRFSGGGTVIVDHNTIFTTFICNTESFPHVKPYPREIMDWSSTFFTPFFNRLCGEKMKFALREDDYVFGEHKFGGNAQSISKDRWLHHTSFLWDFNPSNMEYLAHPKRQPSYRAQRSHLDFLCRLKDFISTKNDFAQHLQEELDLQFDVEEIALDTLKPLQEEEHRRATRFIQLNIE